MSLISLILTLLLPLATSLPSPQHDFTSGQSPSYNRPIGPNSQCFNSRSTRQCWTPGFSIQDDYKQVIPMTGRTVTYNLEITNTTCNPDGHGAVECLLVNNQYPGPTLRANWGDYMVVNVHNAMPDNGTAIHFHGVRQYHSPGSDGVPGLTECPLAPGQSRTYSFRVTQYGTSWYHGHYSSQYGAGVLGPIVFEGPASANYDKDLGPYTVGDWYYSGAWVQSAVAAENLQEFLPPPDPDNILINGTNMDQEGNGEYSQVTITYGKTYRLRLISVATDNYIRVSLDNHRMLIIAADFVPIKPIYADWILLAAGQRYDVVITADQEPLSYWFRAEAATECLYQNNFHALAVWTYSSVQPSTPYSIAWPEPGSCLDPSPLIPYWSSPVPYEPALGTLDVDLTRAVVTPGGANMVVWALNGSIDVDWEYPTMSYLLDGRITDQNLETFPYPEEMNLIPARPENRWNYWLIQQAPNPAVEPPPVAANIQNLPHPIHLHGHDFYILGQGTNTPYPGPSALDFSTPTRRDTANLYGNGWLVVAFESDNPGPWLMHCHIATHLDEGFGMQFLEAPSEVTLPDRGEYERQCAVWKEYYAGAYYEKEGSGV